MQPRSKRQPAGPRDIEKLINHNLVFPQEQFDRAELSSSDIHVQDDSLNQSTLERTLQAQLALDLNRQLANENLLLKEELGRLRAYLPSIRLLQELSGIQAKGEKDRTAKEVMSLERAKENYQDMLPGLRRLIEHYVRQPCPKEEPKMTAESLDPQVLSPQETVQVMARIGERARESEGLLRRLRQQPGFMRLVETLNRKQLRG